MRNVSYRICIFINSNEIPNGNVIPPPTTGKGIDLTDHVTFQFLLIILPLKTPFATDFRCCKSYIRPQYIAVRKGLKVANISLELLVKVTDMKVR